MLSAWYNDRNLRQMALTNPSKKFDKASYFWNSHWDRLRKTVLKSFKQNPWKKYVKEFFFFSHLRLHDTFLIFLNTARGSDKSYMINQVMCILAFKWIQKSVSLPCLLPSTLMFSFLLWYLQTSNNNERQLDWQLKCL